MPYVPFRITESKLIILLGYYLSSTIAKYKKIPSPKPNAPAHGFPDPEDNKIPIPQHTKKAVQPLRVFSFHVSFLGPVPFFLCVP